MTDNVNMPSSDVGADIRPTILIPLRHDHEGIGSILFDVVLHKLVETLLLLQAGYRPADVKSA